MPRSSQGMTAARGPMHRYSYNGGARLVFLLRMNDKLCPDKTRLLGNFDQATLAYSMAVSVLFEKMSRADKSEFQQAKDEADRARALVSEGRAQLKLHIEEHRC